MITTNSLTRKRYLGSLCVAGLLAAMLAPRAVLLAQPKSQTTAENVPDVLLKRLRAQYVPEDDKTLGLTERMKLRRYKAILSEGAFAEQRYAGAANLYELLQLMMLAAKGQATLQGTPESVAQLMAIAERLAQSSAPPEMRLPADLLLVSTRLDEISYGSAEAVDELDVLVARYADTPAAAQALRAAVGLAETGGAVARRRTFLARLANNHVAEPGIRAFLTSEGEGSSAFFSRLLTTRLAMLDGTELVLPRDTLGKPTLLHFCSIERPGLEVPALAIAKGAQSTVRLADFAEKYPSLNIIGINVDTDRAAVQRFVDQQELSWPVAFSGLGWNDPTVKNYVVTEVPTYWLIGPDGRSYRKGVSAFRTTTDIRGWGTFHSEVRQQLDMLGGVEARVPYYRSGAFLLDVPELLPPGHQTAEPAPPISGAIPAAEFEALYALVFMPPTLGLTEKQRADRLRQGLDRGRQIEKTYADADGLWRVRTWLLVAARWLTMQENDAGAAEQSDRLAQSLLARETPTVTRLLAQFVHLSRVLQTPRQVSDVGWSDDARTSIEGFLQSWAKTDLSWAAEILAVILATEASDEQTRMTLMRGFADGRWKKQPKLRRFLRDYCLANIDAFESQFDHNGLGSYGGGEALPTEPVSASMELPRLNGSVFRLPEDAGGKLVIIQFWSVAAPFVAQPVFREDHSQRASNLARDYTEKGNALFDEGKVDETLEMYQKAADARKIDISSNFIVVGVNLDDSRAKAEQFLGEHPEFIDWIQVFSGQGWYDPLARELDILSLPRAVLVNSEGLIERWATGGQFDPEILHKLATDGRREDRRKSWER